MADRVTKVTLRAQVAEYTKGMRDAAMATRTVGTEAEKLAEKREAFQTLGRGLLVAGAAMTAAVGLTVRAAAQWESAWAGVTKTVDGTPEQLERVERGLRQLAKELPASHEEIAAVAEAAGQLGVQTDSVVAFTKTMIDLGETTNLTANDAATQLARFMNIMGTSQDEVSNLGSALVGLGNNYATTESEILALSTRLSKSGVQVNLSEGEVLGLAAALSSVGIEAEAGGSAMSKVLIDIAASVEEGGERVQKFAAIAGLSADEFSEKWRTAPGDALALFVKGLANAEAQGSSTLGVLADLGITEVRMRDALLGSAAASDQFAEAMAMGNEEFEKNNALLDEAEKRYATVESKIAMAGNAVNDAAISFGEVLLPAVAQTADAVAGLAGFFGDLPDPLKATIVVAGGVAGVIAVVGGAALIAVPQVARFKVAMDSLGWSMKGLSLAGGAVGIALTALVAIVGAVAAAQQQARQRAEAYADAISQSEGAVRDLVVQNLQAEESFLWMSRGSAFDAAERLGVSLETLTDAATGNGDAMAELSVYLRAADGDMDALREITDRTGMSNIEAADAIDVMVTTLREQTGAQEEAARLTDQAAQATDDAAASTEVFEQKVSDAEGALKDMSSALEDVGDTALGMGSAIDRAQSAVNRLRDSVEDSKATLTGTNDESIRFRESLRDVETSARDSAQAILDNGGTLEQATEQYRKNREEIIKALEAKGLDRAEAEKWADANLGAADEVIGKLTDVSNAVKNVPDKKSITFDVNTSDAEAKVRTFIRTYDGKTVTMTLQATQVAVNGRVYGGLRPDSFRGNLFEGMQPQHFASGGMRSGIFQGVNGGIFAEAEKGVPWETFISGREADRDRNIGIWMETGRRLGALEGARSGSGFPEKVTLIVEGTPLTAVVQREISAYDAAYDQALARGRI